MVLEAAVHVRPGHKAAFATACQRASAIVAATDGYRSPERRRGPEVAGKDRVLVRGERLGDRTVGFRGSPGYGDGCRRLRHLSDPFPTVEHGLVVEKVAAAPPTAIDAADGRR